MPNATPTAEPLLRFDIESIPGTTKIDVQDIDGRYYELTYPTMTDGRWVDLAADVQAPVEVTIKTRLDDLGVGVTIIAVPRTTGFKAKVVTVEALDFDDANGVNADVDVTGELLRKVPVQRLMHPARYTLWLPKPKSLVNTVTTPAQFSGWVPDHIKEQWPNGKVEAVLDTVVMMYRIAETVGDAPVQNIVNGFGVSRATASRMVARAREAGLLEHSERSKKGESNA